MTDKKPHLIPGDPAPWFVGATDANPMFHFHAMGGRYVVLSFFGSAAHPIIAQVNQFVCNEIAPLFNDQKICFFGISTDPQDKETQRLKTRDTGIRYLWDFDCAVSLLYGAKSSREGASYEPFTLVLDPRCAWLRGFR